MRDNVDCGSDYKSNEENMSSLSEYDYNKRVSNRETELWGQIQRLEGKEHNKTVLIQSLKKLYTWQSLYRSINTL